MRISDWRSDVCSSDRRCSIRACAEAVMAGEPLSGRRRAFRAGGWASAGMIVGPPLTLALVAGALLSLLWTPFPVALNVAKAVCRGKVAQFVFIPGGAVFL